MRAEPPHLRPLGPRRWAAPGRAKTQLTCAEAPQVVELCGAEAVGRALDTVMPDWGLRAVKDPVPPGAPVTVITDAAPKGYSFQSWWSRTPLTKLGLAGASCGVVADLVQSYCDARPDTLGLHCGAVEVGGHLLAFTGPFRAGKTTLVTRLAAEPGVRLFCDDVLPVRPDGQAVALGIQPRLRLPLPDRVSDGFRRYVADHLTVQDSRYGYVESPEQARTGTLAPLAALIVLRREEGARARFHRMRSAEAAAHLIRQNIADPGEAEAHYDRLTDLVAGLFCVTLVYSDLEEAVAQVHRAFAAGHLPAPELEIDAPLPPDPIEGDVSLADLSGVYCRAAEVSAREIGEDVFLWQMEGRNFFRLNPVAGAVWDLLEEPATGHEIAATLMDVFADTPAEIIAADLSALLGQLSARGLVTASLSG